jgi:hypothetical protein
MNKGWQEQTNIGVWEIRAQAPIHYYKHTSRATVEKLGINARTDRLCWQFLSKSKKSLTNPAKKQIISWGLHEAGRKDPICPGTR